MAELVAHFDDFATHRPTEEFGRERFQPYARVRRQLMRLLRIVNEKRRT